MSAQGKERKLARFLGLFSFGLGTAQLVVPDRVNRIIGLQDNARNRGIQRAVGLQELSAAGGIFGMSPPTPFLWSRVGGDALHLTLLARALQGRRNDRAKLVRTIGSVAGIAVVDAVASGLYARSAPTDPYAKQHEGEARQRSQEQEPVMEPVKGNPAVTIAATREEIQRYLKEFDIEERGEVTFAQAPGDRGTEVHVDVKKKSALLKAVGEDPEQKVRDDLRRLKQLIEVGEVTRSDGAPEGVDAKRQINQRAAQPLGEKELAKAGGAE
jgi:hypothetical protein